MTYQFNGTTVEHDEEGYILELDAWSKELAGVIAVEEKIDMTEEHWEVVDFLRDYYEEYQIAPAVRVLIKQIKKSMGKEKGNNKYLYTLFPYGPAKQACKIKGLSGADDPVCNPVLWRRPGAHWRYCISGMGIFNHASAIENPHDSGAGDARRRGDAAGA